MDQYRLLELALEELQREKERIEQEIQSIQAELKGTGTAVQPLPSAGTRRGRMRTPAERKAHSLAMKKYWAAKRKARAAKPAASVPKKLPGPAPR